jgi:hypothetical protein
MTVIIVGFRDPLFHCTGMLCGSCCHSLPGAACQGCPRGRPGTAGGLSVADCTAVSWLLAVCDHLDIYVVITQSLGRCSLYLIRWPVLSQTRVC